jgi:hypothetical protein
MMFTKNNPYSLKKKIHDKIVRCILVVVAKFKPEAEGAALCSL